MSGIQRATGMQDTLPDDWPYWDLVMNTATRLARDYGFDRIDIPILEYTELFERGVGTASDVFVQKEMYTIAEPNGKDLSLRPEFTAGVTRAFLENGMGSWSQPVKLFMFGPIFRRERPQAGRYRQHSQFNAEIMGEMDPASDIEVMMLAMNLYRELGYRGLAFQLNSTGCRACRPAYVAKLSAYLRQFEDQLGDVDKERLTKNPLRVLDSKAPGMDELLADAPHLVDHLCDDCADHFGELRQLLDALDQRYTVNFRLVRGLDYYEKTVFEVWAEGIGAQAALCGGGRYDLSPEIGGHSVPSVGFGSGVERIILGLKEAGIEPPAAVEPPVLIAHFGGVTKVAATQLAFRLRHAGIGTWVAFARGRRSMKSQMREADKRAMRYVLVLGESEIEKGVIAVRPMQGGEQTIVDSTQIVTWLKEAGC
ncbi:MAG: histidine--tRNA ligase [Anaerolineae bacterium]|nr:histidine--tRNA ligase [Anaerolineae bacterium]